MMTRTIRRRSAPLLLVLSWFGCAKGVVDSSPTAVDAATPDAAPPPAPDAARPEAAAPRDTAPGPRDLGEREAPAGCGLANIVSRTFFDAIFPAGGRNPVFTYDGLLEAAKAFPDFVAAGDATTCKKEAAAFLANVSWETGNLRFAEQIAKDHYCQPQGGCPCDAASTDQTKWYYGRGALQLSWNYNYCAAGAALGFDLVGTPSMVSTSPDLAWRTAIWFWMRGGRSCHSVMQPGGGGFGATIQIINGGVECGKGGYGAVQGVTGRVDRYLDYARRLGITDPGTAQSNGC